MKKIIQLAVTEKKVTLLMAVILMISGIICFYIIPRQENPDTSAPVAMLTTVYPGAAPEDVERLVTNKIEDEAYALEGIDFVNSISSQNVSIVIVSLDQSTDYEKQWDNLRTKLDNLKSELPENCKETEVNTDLTTTAGILIGLSGDNYTYEQLAGFAENIKKQLGKVSGMSRFDIDGELQKKINIEVQIEKLNQFNLSLEDIYQLLQAQNLEIPSGSIKNGSNKINVKTPGIFTSIKDIENLIIAISEKNGGIVRLKDIALVDWALNEDSARVKVNGKNAVLLTGYFEDNKNIVLIGKDVREKLDQLKANLPSDVEINEVQFQPEVVSRSVSDFTLNLIEGVLFVVIVVFLGLGLRNALIVSTALPLSIFMTFIAMKLMNIELHMISTMALIIALGILVDNAIVISDSIQMKIDEGLENSKAAIEGTAEMAIPVLTSTLTTVAAFAPLLFLPGAAGEFAASLPQIVIIALSASYFVAMLVTPVLASIFFKPSTKKAASKNKLRNFFETLLQFGLKWKKSTILIAAIVFMLTFLLVPSMGLEFFPDVDKDVMYLDIHCETPGNLDKTETLANQISEILSKEPTVVKHTTSIGGPLPKFYLTIPIGAPSQNYAQILMDINIKKSNGQFKSRKEFAAYLQDRLDTEIAGGKAKVNMLAYAEPGSDIGVRISGEDEARILEISNLIQAELSNLPGTMNVADDSVNTTYGYNLDIDVDIATRLGLTKYDIQRQLNIALYGAKASVYRKSGSEYDIFLKSNVNSVESLNNLGIKSSFTDQKVLIKQVGNLVLQKQTNSIKHYNKDLTVTVSCDVKPGYSAVDIQNHINNEFLPTIDMEGVEIGYSGEREQIVKYFGIVGIAALFAVFVIYIILLIQFNSLKQPLIILVTVPLSIIGSIVGLFLFRQVISFSALLGVASLVGIVVNNAILLIEHINRARKEGLSVTASCIDAVDKRFRPIIFTTATTIIGLVPLIISRSPIFTPMAIALMFGLLVSTVLTLVVIPTVYSLAERKYIKA